MTMTKTDDNSSAGGQGAFGLWADLRAWRQRATSDGSVALSRNAPGKPSNVEAQ